MKLKKTKMSIVGKYVLFNGVYSGEITRIDDRTITFDTGSEFRRVTLSFNRKIEKRQFEKVRESVKRLLK